MYIYMVCLHQNGPSQGSTFYTLLRYFSLKVLIVKSHYTGTIYSPLNKIDTQSSIYRIIEKKMSNFVTYWMFF